jgi:hypothetical protein
MGGMIFSGREFLSGLDSEVFWRRTGRNEKLFSRCV